MALSDELSSSLELSSERSELSVGLLLPLELSNLSSESFGFRTVGLFQLALELSDSSVDLSDSSVGLSLGASELSGDSLGGFLLLLDDFLEEDSLLLRSGGVELSDESLDGVRSVGGSVASHTAVLVVLVSMVVSMVLLVVLVSMVVSVMLLMVLVSMVVSVVLLMVLVSMVVSVMLLVVLVSMVVSMVLLVVLVGSHNLDLDGSGLGLSSLS